MNGVFMESIRSSTGISSLVFSQAWPNTKSSCFRTSLWSLRGYRPAKALALWLIPGVDHDAMEPAGIPSAPSPPLIGFAPAKATRV
jgi:hypothetical protein